MRAWARALLYIIALAMIVAGIGLLLTDEADAQMVPSGACDAIPVPILDDVCDAPNDLIGAAAEGAGNVVDVIGGAAEFASDPVGVASSGIADQITSWVIDGAVWFIGRLGNFVDETTQVQLSSAWFADQYAQTARIGGSLVLGIFVLATAMAIVRRDTTELALVPPRVIGSFIWTALAVPMVAVAIVITDGFTEAIAGSMADDTTEGLTGLASGLQALTGPGGPPVLIAGLLGVLAVVGTVVAWLWLQLRAVGIYLALAFLPILFAVMPWRPARSWAPKITLLLLALLISKPVVVTAMALGVAAVGAAAGTGSEQAGDVVSRVTAGAFMLLAAGLVPLFLLSFVPGAAPAAEAVSGTRQAVARTQSSAASTVRNVMHHRSQAHAARPSAWDSKDFRHPVPVQPVHQPTPPPPRPGPAPVPAAAPTPAPGRPTPSPLVHRPLTPNRPLRTP